MPISVNTTDTFEQWRLKTNDIGSGLETNVTSVYSSLSSNINTLNASIASGTANVFAGLNSNVNTLNSSIASNTAASFAGLTSNVSTLNSSISSNTAAVFAGLTSNVSTLNSSIAANVALIHTNITSNVNTLNTNKLNLSGGTMTGAITTVNGGVGINIGDDSRLADRNESNTLFVEGIQNNDRGYINFSTTTNNALGAVNGGALTWRGATVLHSSNYNSYSPTLTGTGAYGTWSINLNGNHTGGAIGSLVIANTALNPANDNYVATNAFVKNVSLGWGQTWQDFTGSRTLNTTYSNDTVKPIQVTCSAKSQQSSNRVKVIISGVTIIDSYTVDCCGVPQISYFPLSFIVPPGATYRIEGNFDFSVWAELR